MSLGSQLDRELVAGHNVSDEIADAVAQLVAVYSRLSSRPPIEDVLNVVERFSDSHLLTGPQVAQAIYNEIKLLANNSQQLSSTQKETTNNVN